MGDCQNEALRVGFDRRLKPEVHRSKITSNGGLLACRELDDALGLTIAAAEVLQDGRRDRNARVNGCYLGNPGSDLHHFRAGPHELPGRTWVMKAMRWPLAAVVAVAAMQGVAAQDVGTCNAEPSLID